MYRKNSDITNDIKETKAKLDELFQERERNIMHLHSLGISANQIAKSLEMKQQNVSVIIKRRSSLHQ